MEIISCLNLISVNLLRETFNYIDTSPLPFGDSTLKDVNHITLLGSHISASGNIADDLDLHMEKRYSSCLKIFNFCRENKLAPVGSTKSMCYSSV